jgi:glycosyltransferase involved in cell wall biosynthesis
MTYGIVIASYKYGHLSAHCIESVLAQTKKFDKIWFVDDAVGDCWHIQDLYGDRLQFIQNPENLGIVDNFNQMLNLVDTDYVMFLGSDNWLRSDALQILHEALVSFSCYTQLDIITYDIIVTGELKDEIHKFYSNFMKLQNGDYYWTRKNSHHGSMLYNVALAKQVGGYAHNGGERTDEDQNLWDKMKNANAFTGYLNEALLYYRRHKENFNKY